MAHFPLHPSTSAITAPCNNKNDNAKNILISDGMTETSKSGGFSKSLSIWLSGSPLQPRYFCTDIDSCELPTHHSEGSMDRKTHCPSSNSKPNPIQTKTVESDPIIGSDVQSHECLEAMRLPTNQQQQQNKSHSINFLSKNEISANFSTYEDGTKVSSTKPNLSEVEQMALSNDLIISHIEDSNLVSIDSQFTSATSIESVLPIRDQTWGSTDTDIKKVLKL